jgi:hypothetical protein
VWKTYLANLVRLTAEMIFLCVGNEIKNRPLKISEGDIWKDSAYGSFVLKTVLLLQSQIAS